MRLARPLSLAAAVAAFAAPSTASAAQIQLTLETGRSLVAVKPGVYAGDGPSVYVSFKVAVLDDAGVPVSSCLQAGAVHVLDAAGTEVGSAKCGSNGSFTVNPTDPAKTPTQYVARVDSSAVYGGAAVTAVQSAPVALGIRPRIDDQSPLVLLNKRVYPIKGVVPVPNAPAAGHMVLQMKQGKRWRFLAKKATTRFGRYQFNVRVASKAWQYFRVSFVPEKGTGWIKSDITVRVRRSS